MTDYSKSVNFAVKDTLTSGDPNKIVSGAEIDTEFNNIASASGTKADKVFSATANNFAGLNASGNLVDSGSKASDFAGASVEADVTSLQSDKANKVSSATEDNFASLDSNGDLKDSGQNQTTIINISSPTGAVTAFASNTVPSGWLACDGSAVSRTTYADLFSIIGTTFGLGDGTNTFNLPDLRDRFALGTNSIAGTDAGRVSNYSTDLGDAGGADEHQLTVDEMPSHSHDVNMDVPTGADADSVRGRADGNGGFLGRESGDMFDTGGDQPHNNMPPFLALNYIIKT